MSNPLSEVLVYGLGAIGSFYAFILSRNPQVRLTVVARSNFDAVKTNGIKIKSENHGEHLVHPDKVVGNVAEANKKFDYIVCAHKAIEQSTVPPQLKAGIDDDQTTLVIIQNGVGNEEPFRQTFPHITILSCVTWTGARQIEPGVVVHRKSEDMQIGLYPGSAAELTRETERLNQFATWLRAGKTVFQVVPNIQVQRWEKVVWNAAWNSLTTITLMDTHAWLNSSEGALPMTRKVMKEVIDVARALDIPLEYELIDRLLEKIWSMPPIGSSMRTDYESGRSMEVDIILRYPVMKGKELDIDVSTIETMYIILSAINKRLIDAATR